ncbi:hypothetical protein EDD86DRAFT_244243 [Gorgonomyces haynaldii]|nr:hypothetical protein EDD86DRAFT_244243 [Gorgonomyces haynaldii]
MKRKRNVEVVVIPGASGSLPQNTLPSLNASVRSCRWAVSKVTSQRNLDQVMNDLPTEYHLVAYSFGCRVVCELLKTGRIRPQKVVFVGFPLLGPKDSRIKHLDDIKSVDVPILFVSGESDPFLCRSWEQDGQHILLEAIQSLQNAQLEIVEGGHSPTEIDSQIADFLELARGIQ